MNGLNVSERQHATVRQHALDVLTNALKKQKVFKSRIFTALIVLGGLSVSAVGYAQQNQTASPWVSQNGKVAVDLAAKPKEAASKKTTHIRQVSTSSFSQSDDLIGSIPSYNEELEDPLGGELEDPMDYTDPGLQEVDDSLGTMESVSEPVAVPEPLPNEATVPSVATPVSVSPAPVATPVPTRIEATDAAVPPAKNDVRSYPQSDVLGQNANVNNQGPFTRATSPAPVYSTNPYSRIGQAEYNPSQFYGGGGNYSVNGYRNMPPEAAYGQSLCGGGCCGGGCGLFGGLFQNLELEMDVLGMRSPVDFDDTGNAGADVALNWASAPTVGGFSIQAGARGAFTDYNGVKANGFETEDSRTQLFWTAGLFFRSPVCSEGWSGGVVYDSLTENYYREYELSQLRAELSYNFANFCEIGFRGAFGLNEDEIDLLNLGNDLKVKAKATATSYYTMFIRKRFMEGAEATFWGGATEWGEGLIGASAEAPLSESFALRGSASYVFPTDRGLTHRDEECWNMSVGFSWRPGGNGNACGCGSNRPLFDVADNGTFLQNFLR